MGKCGSGLALSMWPEAGYGHPVSDGHGVPVASPTFPASHPARRALGPRCGISAVFHAWSPTVTAEEGWAVGRGGRVQRLPLCQGLLLQPDCPIFPKIWGFCGAVGLSLAPMGGEETWDMHGQHVHEPAPILGAGVRGGTSPATVALPGHGAIGMFPAAGTAVPRPHGTIRPRDAIQLHSARERIPGEQQLPEQGSASPQPPGTVARHQPRQRCQAAVPALPGCGASAPACPPRRPLRRPSEASVSQQWGPIRNEMFLLGYFICTLQ